MPKNWAKLSSEVNEVTTFDHVCVTSWHLYSVLVIFMMSLLILPAKQETELIFLKVIHPHYVVDQKYVFPKIYGVVHDYIFGYIYIYI